MTQDSLKEIKAEILEIVSKSLVPEDCAHAKNVLEWVLRLKPDADIALQLAALGHDIERAIPERRLNRNDYDDFDAFKRDHAENSARIIHELLHKYEIDEEIVTKVCHLIRHHEHGKENDTEAYVLNDADSLSFFDLNLPYYFERMGEAETFFRMQWGYRRLSERARTYLQNVTFEAEPLNDFLEQIKTSEHESSKCAVFQIFNSAS